MPLLSSPYRAPFYLRGANTQTIVPALFRRIPAIQYRRERIETVDDDFLDIDWLDQESNQVALLIHGLEASAESVYMKAMSYQLFRKGYRVAAMNLRGCSGEVNRQARAYHSGSTDDVDTIVQHILEKYNTCEMVMVGFSLGGNLVVKYLGERGHTVSVRIKKAIGISVPCDLKACALHIDHSFGGIYRRRFIKSLNKKLMERIHRLPFSLTPRQLQNIHTLVDWDDSYTAPMYGFENAFDYYEKCSGKNFIESITIPTLILNARNDPFFTPACLPVKECEHHPLVFLEAPAEGGHVGFSEGITSTLYYSEKRALEFLMG